jgi:hypothetical protein
MKFEFCTRTVVILIDGVDACQDVEIRFVIVAELASSLQRGRYSTWLLPLLD